MCVGWASLYNLEEVCVIRLDSPHGQKGVETVEMALRASRYLDQPAAFKNYSENENKNSQPRPDSISKSYESS